MVVHSMIVECGKKMIELNVLILNKNKEKKTLQTTTSKLVLSAKDNFLLIKIIELFYYKSQLLIFILLTCTLASTHKVV